MTKIGRESWRKRGVVAKKYWRALLPGVKVGVANIEGPARAPCLARARADPLSRAAHGLDATSPTLVKTLWMILQKMTAPGRFYCRVKDLPVQMALSTFATHEPRQPPDGGGQ
jgi:hypothetical protein